MRERQTSHPAARAPITNDLIAAGVLLLASAAALGFWFRHDTWLGEYDILSYFLPWFGETGRQVRAGGLPAWMPWLSSGSPLAGDPSGGWWYLPVMGAFAALPVLAAFKAMILVQTLTGGFATYILARLLGMRPVSALVAAAALVFGPFLASQRMFGTVAGQATTWTPVALVGIECALRTPRWLARFAWCGLAGFAISQIAVSWPGQGLVNALLLIGGWVGYRTLLWPVSPERSWRGRAIDALVGPAVLALGLLLAAGGLLPRLVTNAASNIPGGDYTGIVGGNYLVTPHSLVTLLRDTLTDNPHARPVALAAPVLFLAIAAVVIGRTRHGIPYFAAVTVVAGILTTGESVLHQVFHLLPEFEVIHEHSPRRLIWVLFLAPCLLAGAGVESLLSWRPSRRGLPWLLVPTGLLLLAFLHLHRNGVWVGWWPVALTVLTAGLAAVVALDPGGTRRMATGAIVATVILFPLVPDAVNHLADPSVPEGDVEPAACLDLFTAATDPGGAGEFLQEQVAAGEVFRFAGYAGRDPLAGDSSYSFRRCTTSVLSTLVGGRAIPLQLEAIHGYNPLRLAVYAEYTEVMNGGQQDYHWVDPAPSALAGSPLLDMLNVAYIVVSLDEETDPEAAAAIAEGRTEVFRNERVVIYRNTDAFPRAWVVHEVRQDDGTALVQLRDGQVDGQQVAFVAGDLPTVEPASQPEPVTITNRSEGSLVATVTVEASGLVVFSEVYNEGWQATVDGEPVEIVQANHALVGVPVGAGSHTIELRMEPEGLRTGMWLSGITGLAVVAAAIAAYTRRPGAEELPAITASVG